jgi:hypothetical protein
MVYANADITKTEQAAEIIAFAGYWNTATGSDPGLLVFDSQLTTYKILGELTGRGISWLTLRQRGKNELARPGRPPGISMEDRHHRPDRAVPQALPARGHGQAHRPQRARVCQIAVKNTGRDEPTLLITNDLVTPARDLFARFAERMTVENELDARAHIPLPEFPAVYLADPTLAEQREQNPHSRSAVQGLAMKSYWPSKCGASTSGSGAGMACCCVQSWGVMPSSSLISRQMARHSAQMDAAGPVTR